MSDKKFKPVDFNKGAKKVFEFVLMLLKFLLIAAVVVLVTALMVLPAIATKDPSKLIEVPMKVKDQIIKK